MNARMLWLGCAQCLLALSLAGCCCCERAAPRASCGRTVGHTHAVKHHHAGRCGRAGGCGRAAPGLAAHRPLFQFEQVCPYGFPPYNPAPLGYATGLAQVVETSVSRHVEIERSAVEPSPRQAPAQLPTAVDQNAKRLPTEDADDAPLTRKDNERKPGDAPTKAPTPKAPNAKPRATLAQPNHAPRTTEPETSSDANAEDAPSPDAAKQPVSIPAPPAEEAQDDLPANPLRGGAGEKDAAAPAKEAQGDAPSPNPSDATDAADTTEASGEKPDGGEDEWPDAPLPKNDLPPFSGPVR